MSIALWILGIVILVFVLLKVASAWINSRALKMQSEIIGHARGFCEECERAFHQQISQLSELLPGTYTLSVESRLRVRCIGVIYVMQGYLDLAHSSGKQFFPLSYGEQMAMATGIAAEPLEIHGSDDEPRFRVLATELVRDVTTAITREDVVESVPKLGDIWIEALKSAGYLANRDQSVDRMVLGWGRQSATSGLKEWSKLAYAK